MQNWLLTVGICLVLGAAIFAIVFSLIRNRRKGRSPSCGAGCASCAMHGCCHKMQQEAKQ
ncbi:MAG: FeoB-associated Cys-rich membrane protein [Clostridia bacterium]|nr:FeoB-associated Cys-rich membrane protein [Clostridia bacterium]